MTLRIATEWPCLPVLSVTKGILRKLVSPVPIISPTVRPGASISMWFRTNVCDTGSGDKNAIASSPVMIAQREPCDKRKVDKPGYF